VFPTLRVTIVRDVPEWPGILKNMKDGVRVVEKWDVVSRVDSMLEQFCPLLNCIQPACPSHSTCSITHSTLVQPLPLAHDRKLTRDVKPMLNNDSLRQRVKKDCKNMCIARESDEYIVRTTKN
jgi:hypothetical protein